MSLRNFMLSTTAVVLFSAAPIATAQQSEELEMMQQFMSVMDGYFSIIESTHDIASTPEKSAILQMQKIKEIYEDRGEGARAVGVLRQVLSESQNPTIRSAAVLILSDLLNETGRADEAIKVLEQGLAESVQAANSTED
ncbi:MAG: hypothetical protein AAGL69_16060 [Pseudomonadota bacterium]